MGTQTGAPPSKTKGVGTGSTVKAISAPVWATGLLEALQRAGYKAPVSLNNIQNITRVVGAESGGNQAGFLRDNNPWNLNTYTSPHGSLPGGHIVNEWGVNVQVFDSVEQGYSAYVGQLKANPALLAALNNDVSPAMFGGALSQSGWSSASYANPTAFPKLVPFQGLGAVGGQGLTWSASKGAAAVVNAGKTVATDIVKPITSTAAFLAKITNPTTLKNVGIFVAGAGLAGVGLLIFFSQTKTAKGVVEAVEAVA